MADEKPVRHFTVYLAKSGITSAAQAVNWTVCEPPITVKISGLGDGQLFIRSSAPSAPEWTKLFEDVIDPSKFLVPNYSAALIVRVNDHQFALTFGQGGRFLLMPDTHEDRFGLICALNSVDLKTFRSVDVQSLDAIQSHSRIQSGEATTPDQFGLDVEQDLLKAVVGTPSDARLGSRMAGRDALSVAVRADLTDLPFLLNEYRKQFDSELSTTDYDWVNNIAEVKDKEQIASLELALSSKLASDDFSGMWLAIPEIIDWTKVIGFSFTNGGRTAHPDINMTAFRKTLDTPPTIDVMRDRRAYSVDADFKRLQGWTVYKCLYAELDVDDEKFVLNDGRWFSIDLDFVARTDKAFKQVPYSKLALPVYVGGDEGAYNEAVAKGAANTYALMDDKKRVFHGGGHGQVEVCDLFSVNKELIHIKRYGKSSVFSHLFAQGFVSGQLLQIDAEFRKKARAQLPPSFRALLPVDRPAPDELTIVYGVISEEAGTHLSLPFFSRVNLNNTWKVLLGFGFRVQLLKIDVDATYAATVKVAPKGKKK